MTLFICHNSHSCIGAWPSCFLVAIHLTNIERATLKTSKAIVEVGGDADESVTPKRVVWIPGWCTVLCYSSNGHMVNTWGRVGMGGEGWANQEASGPCRNQMWLVERSHCSRQKCQRMRCWMQRLVGQKLTKRTPTPVLSRKEIRVRSEVPKISRNMVLSHWSWPSPHP